jgi:hypothetical protein
VVIANGFHQSKVEKAATTGDNDRLKQEEAYRWILLAAANH